MDAPISDKEIQEGKFFALVSYISFLCILGLVLKKENKFVAFHAKQGLVIFVIEVVGTILSVVPIFRLLIVTLAFPILILVSVWGIWQALIGKCSRIPVVGDIADKIML